jgi:hypothetical protein
MGSSSAGWDFRNTSLAFPPFFPGVWDQSVIDRTGLTGLYNLVLKSPMTRPRTRQ